MPTTRTTHSFKVGTHLLNTLHYQDRGYARSCNPTSENSPSETVWKFGIGPESGLRERPRGSKESQFGRFLLPERRAETPSAIFQTVSPRTPVNRGKGLYKK